jgi:hypothetical protein
MAQPLKHIGRMKNTGVKLLTVFRTLPGESNMALVLPVSGLSDSYHDSIMTVVETDQAQEAFELGEILFTRTFPDGRPMLQALQADNRLQKVATDLVVMSPTANDSVQLDQLNVLIAEQRNCAVDELYTFVSGAPKVKKNDVVVEDIAEVKDLASQPSNEPLKATGDTVLTDKDIAKSYRSQADAMYKEAARLRKEADELDPPQKKATKKVEESADA